MTTGNGLPPEHILIDRCLTPSLVKPLQRLYQLRAVTLADVFGSNYSQTMADVEWITYCGQNNVVALTANPNIWKVPLEVQAIRDNSTRVLTQKAGPSLLESGIILGQNLRVLRFALAARQAMFVKITSGAPTWWIRPQR